MKQMKEFISKNKIWLFALGVIFVVLLWVLISLIFDRNSTIFPSPIVTFQKFFELLGVAYTYKCIAYTLLRIIAGFAISFVLAFIVGVFAGNHPSLYQFLKPLMIVLKSVPTVALVFFFIILFAAQASIFIVLLICFPILYEGVAGGIKNVEKDYLEAAQVDGAGYLKRTTHIKIPLAFPYIVVAMISSFALSFKIGVMAEAMSGFTINGLGGLIQAAKNDASDPDYMIRIFAYSLIAIVLMLIVSLLQEIITAYLKKKGLIVISN